MLIFEKGNESTSDNAMLKYETTHNGYESSQADV